MSNFNNNLKIDIKELNEEEIMFDLFNVEPPMANALRRILISEIPTMAIEYVRITQNTSIIPDEVLSHRLGLIPIFADANEFNYKKGYSLFMLESEELNEFNSIKFKFSVRCFKKGEQIVNSEVLSKSIEWMPIENQKDKYRNNKICVVHDDILVAKLRPGQEIEAELIAVKGIGRTHAKWSPVCTAYYKLLPDIEIKEKIVGNDAIELKKVCPMNVFDIEEMSKELYVKNVRNCTTCRECIRHPKYKDSIVLGKMKDHYLCNYCLISVHVESVGIYRPEVLVLRAIQILKEKCESLKNLVNDKVSSTNNNK